MLEGEALHRDSFGTEQVIAPAGLNPMTSGTGVSHSEEGTGLYRGGGHGVQLCVVQVPTTRVGPADFEPHAELLPVELDHGIAIVLVGESVSSVSPARRDTVHDGVDLDLREGASRIPRGRDHEHARLVLAGRVLVDGTVVEPDRLAYLGMGRDELGWTAAADRFGRAASGRPRVEVGPPEWRRP